MESQSDGSVCEEQTSVKANPSQANPNTCDRNVNDVMIVYEYETEDTNDEYDLAMDGILLNGCSQYLFKFSIIVLPIIFLMVIVIGIFESDSQNNELRCKIARAFIVLGISIGLLALYFLCRYAFHIRSLYRESHSHRQREQQNQSSDIGFNTKSNKMSKKQMKFILQNPWHRMNENLPKEQYSNGIDVYVDNGLYVSSNHIV